jgi:uncharacterized membrane protein YeaQ/YmgE (transglycosylase-associated protein family)
MGVVVYLVVIAVAGLFVGALARLALPGPDPMSIWATIGIGIAGSLAAGMVSYAIWGHDVGGITLSILFATAIVYLIRRRRGGSLTDPGVHDGRRRREG